MAKSIFGTELPNQTYLGTSQLLGQPRPSNWTFNPGTGSYTVDGKQYGRPTASQPQDLGKEYLGIYNKLGNPRAGQVEGGATQGLFYNPTGAAGGFRSLTGAALEDPTVYGNVARMIKDPEADKAWKDMLGQASEAATNRYQGSSFSLAPDILNKMWR